MNNPKAALIWITDILKKHRVPFQISGCLAAIAYGANRSLADIDIDIPENQFDHIIKDVKSYITFGPARFKNEKWDLMLMTLNYEGQEIDLSGINNTSIFNEKTKAWIKLSDDLTKASQQNIFDMYYPTIPLDDLMNYKKILAREVDLIDIVQIEKILQIKIDENLVHHLIESQFPQWRQLPIRPVQNQGWDNRTFHLGEDMLVRMPSDTHYALQVEKEQHWLPILAPQIPLPIPSPIAMGKPQDNYPWHWSIYRYLKGTSASTAHISDLTEFAKRLAEFLNIFQKIDATNGPVAGLHSFYRGGLLSIYDTETRQAIEILKNNVDTNAAINIWETALQSTWQNTPVWVHGDLSPGNLLVQDGQLSAVIDFGQLAIGDPACDLAITWTFFKGKSREIFCNNFSLDSDTWNRGRAWTLWKALMVAAEIRNPNSAEAKECWRIIDDLISEDR